MTTSRKRKIAEHSSLRFGQRLPLDVPVRLRVGNRIEGTGAIRNASISGGFIATALDFPLHTEIAVLLVIRGRVPTQRVLEARVVRIDATGLGVEWRESGGTDVLELLGRAS
jgi:hypothetical protein